MSRYISVCAMVLCLSLTVHCQVGWEQIPLHGAYRFDNSIHETMHIQPGSIEFFRDTTYQEGSQLAASFLQINSETEDVAIDDNEVVFTKYQGGSYVERVKLDYNGLAMVNGASWPAVELESTIDGELRLYNGSGALNVYVGNTKEEVLGSASQGFVAVYDNLSRVQAGMGVNFLGQGYIFADVKNFRIPHPHKSNKEIWYASLEGPEAGAYDRGTAQLMDGEAFIPYSEHYRHVANPETMTVQLTPHHWDTYGLAVVTKSKDGFYVKELKGGSGNFAFDWEVKCVRQGHEDFQVIRDADSYPQPSPQPVKHQGTQKSRNQNKSSHDTHEECALHNHKK